MNREQSQSALPCHHVIMVARILVASTLGRENVRASFCGRPIVWSRTVPEKRQPLGDNDVDHTVCLKPHFCCTLSTIMIYQRFNRSVCFFQWDHLLDESSALVRAGVPSYSDAVTHRSCANFKCEVADRCKQTDSHWFEGCKMGSWWMGSTIPWKHFKICSAWLFSAVGFWFGSSCMPFSALGWLAPATSCEAQGEPVTSRLTQHAWVLCQLYVQGE